MARANKGRTLIWAVGFGAIIVACTVFGAGLKTESQIQSVRFPFSPISSSTYTPDWSCPSNTDHLRVSAQKKKEIEQATDEQRIAMLEARRSRLVTQQEEIEKKLENLRTRMRQPDESAPEG
jgi:hypothetical protein